MKKELNIGIGFVTGRSNVCNVINSYYLYLQEQTKKFDRKVNIVFYILFDLKYQGAEREDFYKLNQGLFNTPGITVKYITPEDIEEKKIVVQKYYKLDEEEVNLIFGSGHARGRNTIMYYAYQDKMDYLLFWDDDEYPVACVKEDDESIHWEMQDNLSKHIEYMEKENADVTIGYHCGYISPIPYMNYETPEEEKVITDFIESISNELITWKSIKEKFEKNNGVTYADKKISEGEGAYELVGVNGKKFVAGSTLCLNLGHIDKIPAFYNPPEARGEDTFFSMGLSDSKIIKVPVYHFHDGFLKYREIMDGEFPKKLKLIKSSDKAVEKRFYKACLGWIKYKPLLMYLMDKENYKTKMESTHRKLKRSIKKIDSLYEKYDFTDLQTALEKYDEDVEKHYEEFLETNRVWKKLKKDLRSVNALKRFSIIMAAYNAEKEIERSIKSVLNQNFKDYEFIIVNDASTDNTAEIVSNYSDIKLITHPENKRAGGARNTGIESATGEYIVFLDSDDILADENVLTKINEKIGKDTPDLIYLGFEAIGDGLQGKFIPTEHNSKKENRIIEWNYANVWDVVWNREFLNKNNIRFVEEKYFEDFVFYYTGVLKSTNYKFTDFISIIYMSGRAESMTTLVNTKKMKDLYYNMELLLDTYNELDEEYKKFIPYILKDHNNYANRLLDQMK